MLHYWSVLLSIYPVWYQIYCISANFVSNSYGCLYSKHVISWFSVYGTLILEIDIYIHTLKQTTFWLKQTTMKALIICWFLNSNDLSLDKSYCDKRHLSSTNGLSLCGKAASYLDRENVKNGVKLQSINQ